MSTLPVLITVRGAAADFVSQFSVACGYTLQATKRSAAFGVLDHTGGVITGQIESDPLDVFPDNVRIEVNVSFVEDTGLKALSEVFDNIPVTTAGVNFHYELPGPGRRKAVVGFDLSSLNNFTAGNALTLSWDHLVQAEEVHSGSQEIAIKSDHGTKADPARVEINLMLHPKASNSLRLRVRSPTGKVSETTNVPYDVIPFDSAFEPAKDQLILLRANRDTALKQISFTAETT